MQTRASCRYLTHPHPAYLGCTFSEICVISAVYCAIDLLLAAIVAIVWGSFFLWLIAGFGASLFCIKLTAKAIGNFKAQKPAGYLGLKIRKTLQIKCGISQPFVVSVTRWSTRRHLI